MDRNLQALDEALKKKIEEKGCTGVAVCIRGPEGVWFEKGYGRRCVYPILLTEREDADV